MIQLIYIKNFKAYEDARIPLNKNNIFIGENDSGKSTVLQALDIFFNKEKIDARLVRNQNENVEIGVLLSGNIFIKKVYSGRNYRLEQTEGNIESLQNLRYIYISPNTMDVKKVISDLSIAKAIQNIDNEMLTQLRNIAQDALNSVIDTIDEHLLVVNGETVFTGESNIKLESAIKCEVDSSGVPIEGRGSGYQKNVLYALLSEGEYENVIIGIDEIENSLSINNAKALLNILKERFTQTLITTHSPYVVSAVFDYEIVPVYSSNVNTLVDLYEALGGVNDDTRYVLVEGKYDVAWIKKCISLSELQENYVVLPCGGCDNINSIKNILEQGGKTCKVIKDGDTHDVNCCLSKACIELYIPLEYYNSIFELNEEAVPNTKNEFFNLISNNGTIGDDRAKRIISDKVEEFLTRDNPLVDEVIRILSS